MNSTEPVGSHLGGERNMLFSAGSGDKLGPLDVAMPQKPINDY